MSSLKDPAPGASSSGKEREGEKHWGNDESKKKKKEKKKGTPRGGTYAKRQKHAK